MRTHLRNLLIPASALVLAGCASVNVDQAIEKTNETAASFTQGKLAARGGDAPEAKRQKLVDELLDTPLSRDAAVQLALANSAAFQSLIAEGWTQLAAADQAGRIANPVFSFERMRFADELEIGRLLSMGLLDLLTLPQRQVISRNRLAQSQLQLTGSVIEQVTLVRQAWVRAVAASQQHEYAKQIKDAAEASAELARRMQQVGNFTKLQRARQQVFYADATAQLAAAQHTATAAREELIRLLGLDDAQAARLKLPDRLPELPGAPPSPADTRQAALQQRLDWQLSRLQLEAAGKAQRLDLLSRLVDTEVGVRRDTVFDNATGSRATRRGYELDVRLPLFDWGGAQRAAMNAQTLAAVSRYELVTRSASSQLREGYSAYRTAYDIAKHYRDEIVPLRKTMSEENVLRYNGMLIGVFELLADTREQIASVMASINAQQQFWLADAAMSAALIGKPVAFGPASINNSTSGSSEGH
ncbi:transporter [Caenimonas koreensis DSM 17982]|uniref:Transporter n=1 Tax=Caenimonas koreensis DSM 17982 TaxID=1121255 RepID=A0A844BCQ4_9BURK|nr:TolC family protein [Caenimonas koreensis]MRD49346.1 transporter [Caenimonas koreensis DSM 17982]